MTTIEITDIADVQDGDIVTLRWEKEPGVTVTLEGPAQDSAVGDYTITSARFVSATREVPEWEPGTVGTATVRGVEGVRVMRLSTNRWVSPRVPVGDRTGLFNWLHSDRELEHFVPDDAEALRAEVERLRAARTLPTREQVAMSMYAELKGALDLSWGRLDPIDRGEWERAADTVLALIEQGGAS